MRSVTQGNNTFVVGFGKGSYTVKGFKAGPGFDLASGWGSVDIDSFVSAFLAP